MSIKDKIKEIGSAYQLWLLSLLMFFITNPYFLWNTRFVILSSLAFMLLSVKFWTLRAGRMNLFLAAPLLYTYYSFNSNLNLNGVLAKMPIVFLFAIQPAKLCELLEKYKVVLACLLVPSILFYLLYLFGFSLDGNIIDAYESEKTCHYYSYPFFVHSDAQVLPRFHAYFDEPGVLGSIGGMLLLADRFNLRKVDNIIILIGCVLSLSLVFWAFFLVNLLLTNFKYKWITLIVLIVAISQLSQIDDLSSFFYRFQFSDGKLNGLNRTSDAFDSWYNRFIWTSDVFWGLGDGRAEKMDYGGYSYKHVIVNYGLIFFVCYIVTFYSIAKRNILKFKSFFLWGVLFAICFYQRPSLQREEFVFVWLSLIHYIDYTTKNSNDGKHRYC